MWLLRVRADRVEGNEEDRAWFAWMKLTVQGGSRHEASRQANIGRIAEEIYGKQALLT